MGSYHYGSFSRRDQDAKDYATIGEKSGGYRVIYPNYLSHKHDHLYH